MAITKAILVILKGILLPLNRKLPRSNEMVHTFIICSWRVISQLLETIGTRKHRINYCWVSRIGISCVAIEEEQNEGLEKFRPKRIFRENIQLEEKKCNLWYVKSPLHTKKERRFHCGHWVQQCDLPRHGKQVRQKVLQGTWWLRLLWIYQPRERHTAWLVPAWEEREEHPFERKVHE